jgi:protein-S-isoprenylcysteine O-methyltransferase Ste14
LFIPLLTVWFEQPRFELDYYWWKWAGLASILMGLALGYWAIRELKKARDEWYSILPTMLVKSGPYQYLRHPVYLSLIFIWIGWWWLWAAAYSFYFGMLMLGLLWLHGYCEEKWVLEKHYGQIYVEYRQKTGMFWVK